MLHVVFSLLVAGGGMSVFFSLVAAMGEAGHRIGAASSSSLSFSLSEGTSNVPEKKYDSLSFYTKIKCKKNK